MEFWAGPAHLQAHDTHVVDVDEGEQPDGGEGHVAHNRERAAIMDRIPFWPLVRERCYR